MITKQLSINNIEEHIWHPYSSITNPTPTFFVKKAEGVKIMLDSGEELIDGMSSWWSTIHGYNHPIINKAATDQIKKMSHVMFGGFTHGPAQELTQNILKILPKNNEEITQNANLEYIFYSDSGSVSVEVAMKMAIQYWNAYSQLTEFKRLKKKKKFATIKRGYHGDTWHAMSVCDPVTGMHSLFGSALPCNFFIPEPKTPFARPKNYYQLEMMIDKEMDVVEQLFMAHGTDIAAFILEPIVQGTGGMRFYSPLYLIRLKELCKKYKILLIFDEIATGFGRTGKMFACEHTKSYIDEYMSHNIHTTLDKGTTYILPDIMTIGKGLTGGYMSMAATICTKDVAETICNAEPGVFMHGPTFMANPLACAVANASINLLLKDFDIDNRLLPKCKQIEKMLISFLEPAKELKCVEDVRVLGTIGVIELKEPVDLHTIQPLFVKHGVWLRPFGKLVYMMPAYIFKERDLYTLCNQTIKVLKEYRG